MALAAHRTALFSFRRSFDDIKDELRAAMTGRRTHHKQHPFGAQWGMFGGQMFGPPWAAAAAAGAGPKARRGDVRAAILAVLAEQPMNGYQIIQEIAERSGGAWKPSPGSIYPTLQQLEDEGLVTRRDRGRPPDLHADRRGPDVRRRARRRGRRHRGRR